MMDNQLRVFSKRQIEIATNNFDENYILGSGGRGKVFKGVFDNNKTVAIKMSKEVDESQREEFVNEIILLSQINHKNIVTLLGCCLEVKIPMLVYELVPNGTLFELLHGNSKNRPIPLATRLKIALDSAEALHYLHSSIAHPIIHGDVKSANILLDDEYCAKVSDFGASNIIPTDNTQVVELFQWTVGYLDPECLCSQIVTMSSDVYSFGVVILEVITRKKAIYRDQSDQRLHLASQFVSMMTNGELHELLDTEIVTNDNKVIEVLQEISELAVWCLSAEGKNRPTMRQVVEKLQNVVRIYGIIPCGQIAPEESQSLLGEPTFYTASYTTIFPSIECSTVLEIDIEPIR